MNAQLLNREEGKAIGCVFLHVENLFKQKNIKESKTFLILNLKNVCKGTFNTYETLLCFS